MSLMDSVDWAGVMDSKPGNLMEMVKVTISEFALCKIYSGALNN